MAKFKSPNILSHLTEKCYSCYSKLPNIRFFDYLCKSRYLEIDCICEGGYEILQYTAGKHIGKEARPIRTDDRREGTANEFVVNNLKYAKMEP